MRKRLPIALSLFLAALCLLLPWSEAEARRGRKARLRVMTFNIRYDFDSDGANRWRHRVDLVARTIEASEAHVVCLQEDKRHQIEDLEEALDGFAFIGRGRNASGSGERCSILVDTDRFRVRDSGDFWLSDTPDVPGSNTWGDRYPRKATWAHLEPKSARGKHLVVINTHLPNGDRAAYLREKGAQVIAEWIEARVGEASDDVSVIVTGDFNADAEGSDPYDTMTGLGLRDAWVEARPQDPSPGTYNGFRGMRTRSRIDWILVGGPTRVLQAAKIDEPIDGRYPSDHYPVLADVEIR